MKYGLKQTDIDSLLNVFANHPEIERVLLYGSRAKGNFKNGSDIDLTLIGKTLDMHLLHRIENEIDDLLLPYKVDLSLFTQIEDPELVDHIRRVGVTFHQK